MKKISLFIALLVMIVFSLTLGCDSNEIEEKKASFIEEYSYYYNSENLKDDWTWFDLTTYKEGLEKKVFVTYTYEEVKAKIDNKEDFVICYGFNPELYQCPFCVACLPIAASAAEECDIDIYYLDIYEMRTNNTEEYKALYNQILKVFPNFGVRISAPTYVKYIKGEPIKYHIATVKDSSDKYKKELTSEDKDLLKNTYIALFEAITLS